MKMNGEKDMSDKNLLLAIDVQQDFMDQGSLGVPGAIDDTMRMARFIRNNMESISNIIVSVDTHKMFQIFHPCWWVDENGKNPEPYTTIALSDLEQGKYKAVSFEKESYTYVKELEKLGKKKLTIWPYHCIQSTTGASLAEEFSKVLLEYTAKTGIEVQHVIKGLDPLSEMYGIFKPEYSMDGFENTELLEKLKDYEKIMVVGEAKSHCVLESVLQIIDHYKDDKDLTSKIYIIEDCMSSIPGFEKDTSRILGDLEKDYGINIVKSQDDFI